MSKKFLFTALAVTLVLAACSINDSAPFFTDVNEARVAAAEDQLLVVKFYTDT